MKKHWGETEPSEYWSLSSEEYETIESYTSSNRLGVAVQLKYIQIVGSFPRRFSDIPPLASEYLSSNLIYLFLLSKDMNGMDVALNAIANISEIFLVTAFLHQKTQKQF